MPQSLLSFVQMLNQRLPTPQGSSWSGSMTGGCDWYMHMGEENQNARTLLIILTGMPQNTSSLTVIEFSCKCHAKEGFDKVAEVVWQTFEMNFYQTRVRKGKNVIQYQRHFPLTGPGDQVPK